MKKKEANFQFLKIIAMLMIVSHHFVTKNAFNIDTQISGITTNKLILQVLGNNAFIGNNLFFLVSAWFLSKKQEVNLKYSIKSCWRIEKSVLFYSITMYIVTMIVGGARQSIIIPNCVANIDRNMVVSNNIYDLSYDLAVLPSSTYGICY